MKPARLVFGFICAALAVLFFHQAVLTFYNGMGCTPNPAYRQTPIAPWGVPALWNSAFWGGMWGVLYAAIVDRRPASMPLWLFTILYCLALPLVLGAWIIVPLIKGLPLFANGNTLAMIRAVGFYSAWGFGLALFWRGLPALFGRPGARNDERPG